MNSLCKKISIIGASGSGKTSLGKALSNKFGYPMLDVDDIYWLPGWIKAEDSIIREKLKRHLSQEEWIVTGNATTLSRELIWPNIDVLVWLDFPLRTLLWRGFKRGIHCLIFSKEICNGNFETLERFLGKKSILLWIYSTFNRRKQEYEKIFLTKPYPCKYIRIKTNKDLYELMEKTKW